ncbi:MAG TPA: AAA family ATPase [Thermoanaerobaculia bacterium]|nr:AAA family ATPase [Thermoanaerobaculia bacterium]HUM29893.1 AAA family ATPase [Thermoanaerobaculia bacterium]HXK68240.1 AAA family ATPase [Thermoanaerobaculia bacterium]
MTFLNDLRTLILLKTPVIAIETTEEERFLSILEQMLRQWPLFTWSASRGLVIEGKAIDGTEDPLAAMNHIREQKAPLALVMYDVDPYLSDRNPAFLRAVKEFSMMRRGKDSFLFLVSSYLSLPEVLKRDVQSLILPPPDASFLRKKLEPFLNEIQLPSDPDLLDHGAALLQGLTEREVDFALSHARRTLTKVTPGDLLDVLMMEKITLVRAGGVVEPIPVKAGVAQIGGLDNLKEWLRMRERFIRSYLRGESTIMPRGLLLMGISGCGKSLSVKAIADIWKLPLFKLDMNLVFSERHGNAERVFHEALRFMESVAPAVLWLDEIEMGISAQADTSTSARVFAHFLTWMQERKELVFVAATANRIDLLPAELIRRGRFDQVFFVDLPSDEERKEIFQVHLLRRGLDIAKFDFITLSQATKNFSGAEVEQCVVSALAASIAEGREMTQDDLYWEIHHIIPLATTMDDQIKSIRSWARKRAVNASRGS